jgi:hypothetical protein
MGSIWISADRWLCIGIVLLTAVAASAAEPGNVPVPCSAELAMPGDEVAARLMSRNADRALKLRHVDSVRQYNLKYTGFPSDLDAQMEVKASYTAPGTKEFIVISESGSSVIRKRVLHKLLESEQEAASDANRDAVQLSTANYRFALLGCEPGDGRPLYVMRVEPLRNTKFLYRGTIWVDSQDFAVTQIEGEPSKKPSFWTARSQIHHEYRKIGEFYLPALNRTVTDVRLGGKAVLTIQYLDYKLPPQVAGGGSPHQRDPELSRPRSADHSAPSNVRLP